MANKISHNDLFNLIDGDNYTGLGGPLDYTKYISQNPTLEEIEQWVKVPCNLRKCRFEIGYGELCACEANRGGRVYATYDSIRKTWNLRD